MPKNVRFIGRRRKVTNFVLYGDGTIGSVKGENEVRRMECRPLLVEKGKVHKEVVQHG